MGSGGGEAGDFSVDEEVIAPAGEHQLALAGFDDGDFARGGGESDLGHGEEVFRGLGERAKAVAPDFAEGVELFLRGHFGEAAVGLDTGLGFGDIGGRKKGGSVGKRRKTKG